MGRRPKNSTMPGIIFSNGEDGNRTPTVDSPNAGFYLPFDKAADFFSVYENEINFYRGVEWLVRHDDFYKIYIKYLIDVVGMNCCQVMPNIKVEDNSKVTFEMHHGPILTLFDITLIICNFLRFHGKKITTFDVADMILDEHQANCVRVVLVTKTTHIYIHDNSVLLNYQAGYGNTNTFLQKYREGVTPDIRRRINKYIEWSKENNSFDNGVFEVAETLKRWDVNDWDTFDKDRIQREGEVHAWGMS